MNWAQFKRNQLILVCGDIFRSDDATHVLMARGPSNCRIHTSYVQHGGELILSACQDILTQAGPSETIVIAPAMLGATAKTLLYSSLSGDSPQSLERRVYQSVYGALETMLKGNNRAENTLLIPLLGSSFDPGLSDEHSGRIVLRALYDFVEAHNPAFGIELKIRNTKSSLGVARMLRTDSFLNFRFHQPPHERVQVIETGTSSTIWTP